MSLTVTKRETPNFRKGRRWEGPVDMIVDHITEGTADSVYNWFGSAKSQVSAHYMVRKDGKRDQFVDENDEAFHAGRILNPTAPLVLERDGINPNWYSIGIEHECGVGEQLTPIQRESSIDLHRDICSRRKIPMTRRHIVGHKEIFAAKSCPGLLAMGPFVSQIANTAFVTGLRPDAPKMIYSDYFKDWLIITRFVSDDEWYFIPAKNLQNYKPTRAQTPLSEMPK